MAQFRKMQRDVEKLRKLNTAYRRKARRVKNLYGVDLGYDVMYIDDFTSRKQFNDYVATMEKATQYSSHRYVKNKHNMVIKREDYQEYQRVIKQASEIAQKEKDDLILALKKIGREPDIQQIKAMGDNRYNRFFVDFKFDNYSDKDFFYEHLKRMKMKLDPKYWRDGDKRLKENFIQAIDESLGYAGIKAKRKVQRMTIKDFKLFFYSSNIPLFDYVYSFEEAERITERIIFMIDRFYKGAK